LQEVQQRCGCGAGSYPVNTSELNGPKSQLRYFGAIYEKLEISGVSGCVLVLMAEAPPLWLSHAACR
jgi:hypothetical protein